jgi:outer membrane protein OmpA-like peptidoglycan-associated protein
MKAIISGLTLIGGLFISGVRGNAQQMGDILKQQAGQGAREGAAIATEKTATNLSNKLIDKMFSKKAKVPKADTVSKAANGNPSLDAKAPTAQGPNPANPGTTGSLQTYSKFDFIAGDKILSVEDFSQDALGDFPDKWNTNSTGEVQTIQGKEGKWLSIAKNGIFYPEFINSLPDNFTLQFDLLCSDNFSFYSGNLQVSFIGLRNPAKEFAHAGLDEPKNSADVWFHPQIAYGTGGHTGFSVFSEGTKIVSNENNSGEFAAKDPTRRLVKVSIWRQRQRLRVYLNEEKAWDMPRAFETGKNYNTVLFSVDGDLKPGDRYLFSNIRLAVGAPDTRNKLITEGKFSTTGILFDVNSAQIKPESYGAMKEIADVLKENGAVGVKIVGHTDSDGDAGQNLTLSKKRSEAVRSALIQEFGIDGSRLQTDGKGSTEPLAPNTTAAGKAQNRRVEFIKQ